MAQLEVSDFAQAVIDRMGECKDARFKQVNRQSFEEMQR